MVGGIATKNWVRDFFACIGALACLAVLASTLYLYSFFYSLPDLERMRFGGVKQIAQRYVVDRVVDKERRFRWVEHTEVSRELVQAIVASEDPGFLERVGMPAELHQRSLARTVARHLFHSEERETIRRLREALIARELETKLAKHELAELYLNILSFGPGLLGVNAAAHFYFAKAPNELNAAEGAYLAVLLSAPLPVPAMVTDEKAAVSSAMRISIRRILADMLEGGQLSAKEYQAYVRYDYSRADKDTTVTKRGILQRERGLAGSEANQPPR